MNQYESLIDATEFGVVADYLRNPRTPILFLLHVKSEAMLATLAGELDKAQHVDVPPGRFPDPVEQHVREGSIFISSRHPLIFSEGRPVVQATVIPRHATSRVIYFPPFYLVHTPGLFEGTLIGPRMEQKTGHELRSTTAKRFKI